MSWHADAGQLRSRRPGPIAFCAAAPNGVNGATVRATDALGVLRALASDPATAADALTLLHELQMHQIELDL